MDDLSSRHSTELHQILLNIYGKVFLAGGDERRQLEDKIRKIRKILEERGQA